MSDYFRGFRIGLVVGLSLALCVCLHAYGFTALITHFIVGALLLIVVPLVYHRVQRNIRAKIAEAEAQERGYAARSALRRYRLRRAAHLRAVSDDVKKV